ncbi:carboxypeptidase-like regulatory domain-containing protein [Bacteroides sp.]|uniref:energy transducer TonB n=1 Tax=Bacteroides sp. TaxID=29523 RepID=UPI0025BE8916|nr:carboxypeptidase-like regulatory domain-containing protein [Bacteroides sp.]
MKLLDYIRGNRKGKKAHRLQKEAMRDPFLADAMDGYDGAGQSQEQQIELLRRRITMRVKKQQNHAFVWSVAVSLLLGVCLGGYFLFQKDKLPEETLMALEQLQRDTILQTPSQILVGEEVKLAKTLKKDSMRPLISQERRVKPAVANKAVPPEVKEQTAVEVEMSLALSEELKLADSTIAADDNDLTRKLQDRVEGLKDSGIKGRVTDENGEPLVGANILVKGTSKGTVSDVNGNFTLDADVNKEIAVNYIGYEPITLPIDTGKDMLIAMNESKEALNEVVVVGYGTERKKNLTGSVVHVEPLTMPEPVPVIGFKAYKKYLKKNRIRPTDEECAKVKGEVVLTFHVDKKGRPVNIKIKNTLCASADKEAIRLVEDGPDWLAGNKEVTLNIKF